MYKEDFLVAIKDKQKIGTNELEDGQIPKSALRSNNVNYESCYSTETRNGNSTGRHGNFFCNQGIDGGEVIPAEGLYSVEFSNYTLHPGKAVRGQRLNGTFRIISGKTYTFTDGIVNSETLTLAQSKTIADSLAEQVHAFVMVIPTKNSNIGSRTIFISKKEEGWEDPDTYIKMTDFDETNTNIVSYVKKDLNAVEKNINQAKINETANKYKNLPTCNWKQSNRCIFKDYVYNQSNGNCVSKDNLSYNVDLLKSYDENSLSDWLKTLHNRDMGVDKLSSEAMNVHEYINRCKDIDGYEFLSNTGLSNPYIPTTKPGDVKGRYIRVTINNRDVNQNWLQLAEVQVINNNKNIALGKSSTGSGNYPGSTFSKGNDGNNDGNWNNGSLYISGNGTWENDGSPQFWEVDLGDAHTIDRIIITNRTDCCRERLNNWLLSIYDYNKNLIWARIFPNHPNPKFIMDIKASDNDMKNIKVKDYERSRFNKYFYRVSNTEYNSKRGWTSECAEECHKNICEGENKKWIGNNNWYGCREYKPGEKEEEMKNSYETLNGISGVWGRLGWPPGKGEVNGHIYLGKFSSAEQCEAACNKTNLCDGFSFHNAYQGSWQGTCYSATRQFTKQDGGVITKFKKNPSKIIGRQWTFRIFKPGAVNFHSPSKLLLHFNPRENVLVLNTWAGSWGREEYISYPYPLNRGINFSITLLESGWEIKMNGSFLTHLYRHRFPLRQEPYTHIGFANLSIHSVGADKNEFYNFEDNR